MFSRCQLSLAVLIAFHITYFNAEFILRSQQKSTQLTMQFPAKLKKLVRFIFVGVSSALVYFLAVWILIEGLAIEPVHSSVIGYFFSLPISFFGHKFVTFQADGKISSETVRFLLTHSLGIVTMYATMYFATEVMSWPFWTGTALGTVLVPTLSFILFDNWVFRSQRHVAHSEFEKHEQQ